MCPVERDFKDPKMKVKRGSRPTNRTRYVLADDNRRLMSAKGIQSKKQLKVLVVDDKELYRKDISQVLIGLGHSVITADNGHTALEAYDEKIDLVILDFNMPGMNGDIVFEKLKEANPHVKVIFCSKGINRGMLDKLRGMGMVAFLPKPVSPMELGLMLQTLSEEL